MLNNLLWLNVGKLIYGVTWWGVRKEVFYTRLMQYNFALQAVRGLLKVWGQEEHSRNRMKDG